MSKLRVRTGDYSRAVLENGWLRLFNAEPCENCGTTCEVPDSIKTNMKLHEARQLGIKIVSQRLPEQFFNDDLGHCTCERCDS